MSHGERGAVKRFHRAIRTRGDNKLVELRDEEHSLGLGEPLERARHTADSQINHLDRVLRQRREERPATLHVDSEMINAPVDFGQRDRLHELEGGLVLCECNGE